MKWWKKAAIATLALIALIAIGDLYIIQRINKEAASPAHERALSYKLGKANGQMFTLGLVAIWVVAWRRECQKRKRCDMAGLFSMDGRLNRARYFWLIVEIGVVSYVVSFVLGLIVGMSGGTSQTAAIMGGIVGIVAAVVIAFPVVQRFHDLDRPGSHYWLLLIPFYGFPYLSLVLLFKKGTDGANRYGPDPLAARGNTRTPAVS